MPATSTASAAVRTRLIRHPVSVTEPVRAIGPDAWRAFGNPLLRNPRGLVKRLYDLHRPETGTAVVAVLDADGRPVASASFALGTERGALDGWECRNIILSHLRMIVPDDLRRATPVRTAVLLVCRDGARGWEPDDGRWMWGLRDACELHGLRCGAFVVLAEDGWQVVGDGRGGRTPVPVRTPRSLPVPSAAKPAPLTPPPGGISGTPPPPVELPTSASRVERPDIGTTHTDHPQDTGPQAGGAVMRLVPDVGEAWEYSSA